MPARALLMALDWMPVRLTALSFAVVGDFEDAVACWRTQAARWSAQEGGMTIGILLAAGGGALGVQLGGMLPTLSGDPDVRPELGHRRSGRARHPAVGGRARVARARAVAAADPAGDDREPRAVNL